MYFNDLLTKLIYLTKRNNITNSDIGKAINLDRQAMSGRALRNTRFKDFEIEAVEKYFNVDFSKVTIYENTFERQNDISIPEKISKFGIRLSELRNKSGLTNQEFSELLGIDEEEYEEFKNCERKPNIKLMNAVKQHFKVSADLLLYGE